MDKQNYKPRIIDARVKEYLSAFGAARRWRNLPE